MCRSSRTTYAGLDSLMMALAASDFRRRFALSHRERRYLAEKGWETVMVHGRGFIEQRLASARPHRDGKQTPMRGHPIFVAQHATGTCCRGCLWRWHGIARGAPLSEDEQAYVQDVLECWLRIAAPGAASDH